MQPATMGWNAVVEERSRNVGGMVAVNARSKRQNVKVCVAWQKMGEPRNGTRTLRARRTVNVTAW